MIITAATNNKGKLREIRAICEELNVNCIGLAEAGIESDPEETGDTLRENAAIKARAVFKVTGTPVIADDSGLFINALGGLPGVHSARYEKNDLARIDKVLKNLEGVKNREAQFRTTICFINEYGIEEFFNGFVEGEIAYAPQGENGFGYDPIFLYPGENGQKRSFAEINAYEKNIISHRANALRELKNYLGEKYSDK
jgi:XTP/dITP diphosphohydrolase